MRNSPLLDRCIRTGILALAILAARPLAAAPSDGDGPAVTVYSSADPAGFDPQKFISQQKMGYDAAYAWQVPGFGIVRETRDVDLDQGANDLRFSDVAQFIDPTTVSFSDLTSPETAVLEQNFEFDLVNPRKLLEKYLGRTIRIGSDDVTLLSATGNQLVVEREGRVAIIKAEDKDIVLGDLPGGLITKPTLVWKVQTASGGTHKVRTTYQTAGLTWRADYNLLLNADDTAADLGAWVTLMNVCGRGFENARLKLIAGDVQRVQPQPKMFRRGAVAMAMEAEGFEEKEFFEYHLYTLPRRTDILSNGTQQITLFPTARNVAVEKVLVYYGLPEAARWGLFPSPQQDRNFGNQSNPKVDVYIRFRNDKESNLGMPLPAGKVRVFKEDEADGSLEFVGEDLIDHTPKDEELLILVGKAFDVVGERTQADFRIETGRKTMRETIQIQIRNHKSQAQRVIIKENLYRWITWRILSCSDNYKKVDARTIHIEVEVPPDGEKTVTYTVKYTW